MASTSQMLRTDVYHRLKVRLLAGELRSGQFVSQRELTSLLGATLNPVREAIRRLEAEGLINIYAQRGIQVIEARPKTINDSYEYRLLLELNAIRHFATSASRGHMAKVRQNVEKSLATLARSPDSRAVRLKVLDDDYTFHKDLIDFQGNEIISKHYSLNAARVRLFRINIGEPLQRLEVAAKEHLGILDACLDRDVELAVTLLAKHIEISREHTLGIRPVRWSATSAASTVP